MLLTIHRFFLVSRKLQTCIASTFRIVLSPLNTERLEYPTGCFDTSRNRASSGSTTPHGSYEKVTPNLKNLAQERGEKGQGTMLDVNHKSPTKNVTCRERLQNIFRKFVPKFLITEPC